MNDVIDGGSAEARLTVTGVAKSLRWLPRIHPSHQTVFRRELEVSCHPVALYILGSPSQKKMVVTLFGDCVQAVVEANKVTERLGTGVDCLVHESDSL